MIDMNVRTGLIVFLVVEPVPDPLGINNPSAERWMAVQTVGADAGAEGSLRVLEKSGSGWSTVTGNVPRVEISNPAAILLSQKLAPFYAYEITENSLPGESFVAPRDFQPTSLKVLLGKTGEPTSSVTFRLLTGQGTELWSQEATPSGEGWLSLPVSGVTLAAGSRYRLVADSHAEGDHWKLLSSIGPSSSLGPPSSWDGEVSGFTQAFDRIGFNDRTSEASDYDSWASDFWAFNSSAQDALYLGDEAPFDFARVDGYVEGGTTVTFSYWNGSSWANLPTTRNTFALDQGTGTAEWQMPQDWATATVAEKTAYWVKVDGTASSATPLRISRTTGIRNFKSPTAGPGGGTYVPFAWEDHDISAIVANAWGPGDVLMGTESPTGDRYLLGCGIGGRLEATTGTAQDGSTISGWYYWANIRCDYPTIHLGLTLQWGSHDGEWEYDNSGQTVGCWSHEDLLCSHLFHSRSSTCVSINECASATVHETRYKIMLPYAVTHVQRLESDPYWRPWCDRAGSDQSTIECFLQNKGLIGDMNVRTRIIVFLVIALGSAFLPFRAAAEDVFLQPFPPDWGYEGCIDTVIEYNFETATFMTPFKREGCYTGTLLVTVTMTRYAYNKLLFQNDPPVTITATAECPASQDCEFRVSMPHPNPEEAYYGMSWSFRGPDAEPAWVAWKWEAIGCDSYVIFARCGAFGEYWVVQIPDT